MSCEQCTQGYVLEGEPQGTMVGDAYLRAASAEGPSKAAVVLLTAIFGLALVNSKLIADEISKRLQCDVWVPDLFAGAYRRAFLRPAHILHGVRVLWLCADGVVCRVPAVP